MDMLRVAVFVESWQLECCGTPPGVGDRVEWRLSFRAEPEADPAAGTGGRWDPAVVTLAATAGAYLVEPDGGGTATELTRLDAGGLHAFWSTGDGPRGPVRVTGRLTEDHHVGVPSEFPPTVGEVARVRVVSWVMVPHPTRSREWERGPGARQYREVDRSPRSFDQRVDPGRSIRSEGGVLVDLVVPVS